MPIIFHTGTVKIMLSEQTRTEVIELLAQHLSLTIDDITEDSRIIDELGADSLDIVELAAKYEDTYNIEVSDSDIMKIKTVSDIFDYIENNTNIR